MDKSVLLEKFTTIGINYRRADVTIRERFSLNEEQKRDLLADAELHGIPGMLLVTTCNRTEILAQTSDAGLLSILLTRHCDAGLDEFREYGFIKHGEAAVLHFYRVAVGLEAQILGDLQIIKQVKEAYRFAVDCNMADALMHRLMQSITRAHKRTRNETSLGIGAATTAYAAVQMAKKSMKSLHNKRVLLVGAGKIGKVTCKNLVAMGASDVTIVNRSSGRAEELGGRFNVNVASMDDLDVQIARADLVIVATGAQKPVILKSHFEICDPDAGVKTLIDLSVPRNIDRDVETLPFVELINMDMLNDTTDETFREREASIPVVERIIAEEFENYCTWMSELRVVPTIKALNDKFDTIRRSEIDRYKNKITEDTMQHVEQLTRRIVNKIVAHSIEHLKENQGKQEEVTRVIQDMYKIEPENRS